MTVASTVDRVNYTGSGITGPYAYSFRVFAITDLLVTTRDPDGIETTLTPSTDFTATGILDRSGGTVTLTTALASGWTMSIRRVRPLTQGTELRNQGPYFPETVEDTFDNACMVDQQLSDAIARSVQLPETIDPATFDSHLPATMVPGDAIVLNAAGDGWSMTTIGAATLTAWNAAQNLRLDVFTSAHGDFTPGTTTSLTLTGTPGGVQNITVSRRTSGAVVLYETDEYTISGTTLTFSVAIPSSTTRVEVRYLYTYQVNTADAANVTYAPASGPGTDVQTRLRSLDAAVATIPVLDVIQAADYGVVGDGVTDDTTAMQAALTAGATLHKVVSGGNLKVTISGPLTMAGPGLVFNFNSFGNSTEPIGIHVTGSGYTALTTTTDRITAFVVTVWGTGNTANGIYFNAPSGAQIQKIRVYDLDGFGVKIDKMFDSTVLDVSVELCGNASNYAFSVNAAGDTSNASHIGRIQCEQANQKAILIDSTSLNMLIDDIHSERATPASGVITWDIGGTRSVFNTGRFTSNAPSANATIYFRGENTTFNSMAVEDSVAVVFDATSSSTMTFNAPNFGGASTSIDLADHTGLIQVIGGMLGTFNVGAEAGAVLTVLCLGTKIAALAVGDCSNPSDPNILTFRDCIITALSSTSANSAATFDHCTIKEGNNLLQACTVLTNGTVVTCAGTLAGTGCVIVRNSTINANVLMDNASTLLASGDSRFNGTLGQTTSCASLIGPGCYATGTVTGLGIPTRQPSVRALSGGVWRKGQVHWNVAPAAGDPPGWVCTTGGATGTFVFKAMAALAP